MAYGMDLNPNCKHPFQNTESVQIRRTVCPKGIFPDRGWTVFKARKGPA